MVQKVKLQLMHSYLNVAVTTGTIHEQWFHSQSVTHHLTQQVIDATSRAPRCTQHDHVRLNNHNTLSLTLTQMLMSTATETRVAR